MALCYTKQHWRIKKANKNVILSLSPLFVNIFVNPLCIPPLTAKGKPVEVSAPILPLSFP